MDSTAQKPDLKAVPTSVKEIEFQETSLDIWESKYCLKTKKGEHVDGNIDETYQRVAKALSAVEEESKADALERTVSLGAASRGHSGWTNHLKCRCSGTQAGNVNDQLHRFRYDSRFNG